MKFGKKILTVSEASESLCASTDWMDYKHLKKLVKSCEEEHKKEAIQLRECFREKRKDKQINNSECEKAFFKFLLKELKKVAKVYRIMEAAVLQDFLLFVPELESLKSSQDKTPSPKQIARCMKECAEHHLKFVLLENYAVMNYCGFTKILKKHDKVTGYKTREKYMIKMVNEQPFSCHKKINIATKLILNEFYILQSLYNNVVSQRKAQQLQQATITMAAPDGFPGVVGKETVTVVAVPSHLSSVITSPPTVESLRITSDSALESHVSRSQLTKETTAGDKEIAKTVERGLCVRRLSMTALNQAEAEAEAEVEVETEEEEEKEGSNEKDQHELNDGSLPIGEKIEAKKKAVELSRKNLAAVKDLEAETTTTEAILTKKRSASVVKHGNRFDDLVSLLEKHQQELSQSSQTTQMKRKRAEDSSDSKEVIKKASQE